MFNKFLAVLSIAALLHGSSAQDYWLDTLSGQGRATFNTDPGYQVFRNIRDFGAVGDGVTDDTAAINAAIDQGNRCGVGCGSSTVSPAIIYFPPGEYLISGPLLQYYFTQFIGHPSALPTLIMSPDFPPNLAGGLINSNEYTDGGTEAWTNQNNFYRQVRNLIIDMTRVPASNAVVGIHWQVAQATTISNVHIRMNRDANNQQYGIWMENGSGGFMSDLTIDGGGFGLWVGNQQFTSRNITITNADTALFLNWDWGWTFKNLNIDNARIGVDISTGDEGNVGIGSILLLDSSIRNTQTGILTVTSETSQPTSAGTLTLDNVQFENVQVGVQHTSGQTLMDGGTRVVASWSQGISWNQNGNHQYVAGDLPAPSKPQVLLDGQGNFFERPKPSYEEFSASDFVSVKDLGAAGDGQTDDTAALQNIISSNAGSRVIYFPHGHYIVSDTIVIPVGTRIVGEIWPNIFATGGNFADPNNPRPVLQLGNPGDVGTIEISDLILSVAGPVPGAILVQVNARDPDGQQGSVGLWDVHFRIGGAAGTRLQSGNCRAGGGVTDECFGAYLMLHIAQTGSAYLENVWAWVADHDLDGDSQVSIYNGRGILVESTQGPVWMYGTASEHSVLYQYNFVNTQNAILAMIQTESPYYQANPPAPQPYTPNPTYHDPDFATCPAGSVTCPMAWGLILDNTSNFYLYGAGLYNFFQNYDQGCLDTESCQDNMVSITNSNQNIQIYNLNTKASSNMVVLNGNPLIPQGDHRSTFCSTIANLLP